MKLKHTNNFIKKDTVAIFVKVEKEKPKVCSISMFYNIWYNDIEYHTKK
ncbi:hypothetical protein [Brachyspira pilosicoli]|nr:hypothetical protein [Brachyspira pilosicoli]